jgi:protein-S-isoprenylcysteine O-methyltransferase Ste14
MPDHASLGARLIRRGVPAVLLPAALLFVCAGTMKFWQAWAVIILGLTFPALLVICFYKRDPQLIERRLLKKESVPEQKIIMKLGPLVYIPALALPGLDYRFGWSHEWLAPVPLWLTVVSLILVLGCHLMFFWVVCVNRYAARVIRVESGQTVADTGPYRLVRHPMYSASVVSTFCIPLALGSFVALPVYLLWNPLIVYRLLNEEEILRRDLPGYVDYCQRMRYRLIPLVW